MADASQPRRKPRNDIEHSVVREPVVVPQVKLLKRPAVLAGLHFPLQHPARAEQEPLRVRLAGFFEELRQRGDPLPRALDRRFRIARPGSPPTSTETPRFGFLELLLRTRRVTRSGTTTPKM